LKSITNVTGQVDNAPNVKMLLTQVAQNMGTAQTAPRLVPFRRTCTNAMRTHFSVTRAVPRRIAKRMRTAQVRIAKLLALAHGLVMVRHVSKSTSAKMHVACHLSCWEYGVASSFKINTPVVNSI
jgi:hypothetical protein